MNRYMTTYFANALLQANNVSKALCCILKQYRPGMKYPFGNTSVIIPSSVSANPLFSHRLSIPRRMHFDFGTGLVLSFAKVEMVWIGPKKACNAVHLARQKEELDMTYSTWNLFREMESLRREVERAFEQTGYDWRRPAFARAAFLPGNSARAYPLMNLSEDKDHLYVEALAPGVDPATLDISVLRDTLTVTGEKQAISEDIKPEAFHRNERGAGKFTRAITLPVEVDGNKVTAQYTNGLLLITLPKAEAAKPKQISVKVA